jgi:hypothetical protein
MAIARQNGLLEVRMQRGLRRGQETRAKQDAGGSQRECRRQAAPVGDAASGKNRFGGHRRNHLRDQHHRTHHTHMPATFTPLGHDDIGACLCRPHGIVEPGGHMHHVCTHIMCPSEHVVEGLVGSRPSKRGHSRSQCQDRVQRHLITEKEQHVESKRGRREFADAGRVLAEFSWTTSARPQCAEASGVRNGCDKCR